MFSVTSHWLYVHCQVVLGIVQFFVVVGASLLIGAVVGCLAVLMTKYSEHVHGRSDLAL